MFTSFKRVFTFALNDFSRNKSRSVAAIFVLTITIFLVTGLFFLHGMSNFVITQVQNKIDITAYFKPDTVEQDILNIKDQLLKNSLNITSIQYVSKDEALQNFTQRHQDNPVFSQALTQVGDNPFLPSLNITTTGSALEYQQIANILQSDAYQSIIDKVDYADKKATIEKLFSITSTVNTFGLAIAVIFVLVAVLVVFNTIKLAIDSAKEEINTMRIVGASAWFTRAPFVIQGVMFGCIAFVICFFSTITLSYFLSSKLAMVMPGFSIWDYAISHFFMILAIQLFFGIGLGALASVIVVQKYLKI